MFSKASLSILLLLLSVLSVFCRPMDVVSRDSELQIHRVNAHREPKRQKPRYDISSSLEVFKTTLKQQEKAFRTKVSTQVPFDLTTETQALNMFHSYLNWYIYLAKLFSEHTETLLTLRDAKDVTDNLEKISLRIGEVMEVLKKSVCTSDAPKDSWSWFQQLKPCQKDFDLLLQTLRTVWYKLARKEIDQAKNDIINRLGLQIGEAGFWDLVEQGEMVIPGYDDIPVEQIYAGYLHPSN